MSNTEILKRGLAAWENGDEATLSALLSDDFQMTGPTPQPLGKAEFLGFMHAMNTGMPDFAFNVFSAEEVDSETVVVKTRITATHTGTLTLPGLPPIPATGKKVALPVEVGTYSFAGGKLRRLSTDASPDGGVGGMLAQLGVPLPKA